MCSILKVGVCTLGGDTSGADNFGGSACTLGGIHQLLMRERYRGRRSWVIDKSHVVVQMGICW